MADLTYRITTGSLKWKSKNLSWKARSGLKQDKSKISYDPLPVGIYEIDRRGVSQYTSNIAIGFKDKQTGKGFFVPIKPKFETERGKKGGRLGIHPDGNIIGTMGCIGIIKDSKSFYDAIGSTANDAKLTLKVFDV